MVIVVPRADDGLEYSLPKTRDKRRHQEGATPYAFWAGFSPVVTIIGLSNEPWKDRIVQGRASFGSQ